MDAGYDPSDLDRWQLWQVRHKVLPPGTEQESDAAESDAAVRSYLTRQRGGKVEPAGIDVNADTPMAAAVRAAREARKHEQAGVN